MSNSGHKHTLLSLSAVFVASLWPITVNRLLGLLVLPAEVALATALLESVAK